MAVVEVEVEALLHLVQDDLHEAEGARNAQQAEELAESQQLERLRRAGALRQRCVALVLEEDLVGDARDEVQEEPAPDVVLYHELPVEDDDVVLVHVARVEVLHDVEEEDDVDGQVQRAHLPHELVPAERERDGEDRHDDEPRHEQVPKVVAEVVRVDDVPVAPERVLLVPAPVRDDDGFRNARHAALQHRRAPLGLGLGQHVEELLQVHLAVAVHVRLLDEVVDLRLLEVEVDALALHLVDSHLELLVLQLPVFVLIDELERLARPRAREQVRAAHAALRHLMVAVAPLRMRLAQVRDLDDAVAPAALPRSVYGWLL
mmetsp:Transcript_12710/g.38113  ORF Transcript_12710/g.38113 Transcript_12710/m.38113 type:complete len:318 (+) Transcript_12710:1634-2587(+)